MNRLAYPLPETRALNHPKSLRPGILGGVHVATLTCPPNPDHKSGYNGPGESDGNDRDRASTDMGALHQETRKHQVIEAPIVSQHHPILKLLRKLSSGESEQALLGDNT